LIPRIFQIMWVIRSATILVGLWCICRVELSGIIMVIVAFVREVIDFKMISKLLLHLMGLLDRLAARCLFHVDFLLGQLSKFTAYLRSACWAEHLINAKLILQMHRSVALGLQVLSKKPCPLRSCPSLLDSQHLFMVSNWVFGSPLKAQLNSVRGPLRVPICNLSQILTTTDSLFADRCCF